MERKAKNGWLIKSQIIFEVAIFKIAYPHHTKPTYHANMPMLDNPRHEIFAQEIAKGTSQFHAYIRAGYSPNGGRANAARLITNDSISQRINELMTEAIENSRTNLKYMVRELTFIADKSIKEGQYHAALRALALKAKLTGFL